MSRWTDAFGDWTPRAVVFDCDGLLLDTESVWDRTQRTILERHGATLSEEAEEAMVGSTLEVAAQHIAEAAGADPEAMVQEVREEFVADLAAELRIMPGAEALLRACSERVPLACASNSWHAALVEKLERTGLLHYFSALESTDTVEQGKPAPDMYAQGAAALGAAPGESLAFEDSATGARAALAAGLRLVTVPPEGARMPEADLRITTLEDPELLAWIATWPRRVG